MNEISHQQAQYLIRRAADRKLPEEQWGVLQAHLEGCEACRAYQSRLAGLQKDLRRTLRERWRFLDLPFSGLSSGLADARRARQARRKRALSGSLVLLVLVALAVFARSGGFSTPEPAPTQPAAQILPSPTPTPPPGERFQGLVAFESRRTGDSEIYLLNISGGESDLVNLSQHPGEDTHPAWSPDGEWLAFLSDRSDRRELFVISVAGSRLMQITHAPEIRWEGPLEWSPDGQWIRLGGRRIQQNDDLWTYLVPLDGSGPVSIPGSRGASPEDRARFGGWGYLGYDPSLLQDNYWFPNQADIAERWSSLAPHPENMVVAALQKSTRGADCQALQLFYPTTGEEARFTDAPQLCVAGQLQRTNWAPNRPWDSGAWLVLAAHPRDPLSGELVPPGEADTPGIYALKIPYLLSAGQPWPQERLADLEPGERPALTVRPVAESLGIQPAAVARRGGSGSPASESAASPPPDVPGDLLIVQQIGPGSRSAIITARADGSERHTLVAATASNTCPAWSPDHTRIAFLSDRSTRGDDRGQDEVFLLDYNSREVTQLTRMAFSGRAAQSFEQGFSCPVWSPDGRYLATISQVGEGSAVLVLNESGQVLRNALVSPPVPHADLLWTPDGQSILLAQPAQRGSSPRITRVPWRQTGPSLTLLKLDGWDDVHALSLSPDGEQLAFIYARYAAGVNEGPPAEAHLRVVRMPDLEILYDKELPNYDPYMPPGQGRIAWLQEKQLVFAIPQNPLSRHKALLLRYDPAEDTMQTLAAVEDTLYDWALNGAWLVYSSESGLWGVPVDGRFDAPTVPLRLSDKPAASLYWR